MIRITALSFGTAAALGLLAEPALAVECGEVITRHARLDRDLVCTTNPALTVDGGSLDLGRFTVVCDHEGPPSVGIVLKGQRAHLRGGAVTGCELGIHVAGSGRHTVRDVTVSASNQGVLIGDESDRNRFLRNNVLRGTADAAVQVNGNSNELRFNNIAGSEDQGFEINGSDNRIEDNTIGGVGEGIQLTGEGNHVTRNRIIGTLERGVEVRAGAHVIAFNLIADGGTDGIALVAEAQGNHVTHNAVYRNGDAGIEVNAFDNRIERNRVLLNEVDLQDRTADCDNNQWRGNVFETSESDDCVD
jgi:Periplasmic copper-binding protein (NosD)